MSPLRARHLLTLLALLGWAQDATAGDGNRLRYLDELNPYYVGRTFPKLATPQWIGEPGVRCAVVLAIDDMRGHAKWEAYLRPILERLKQIDGRAAVSIMTCQIDPAEPHLARWLEEGVSLEVHTLAHPCPLLAESNLPKAKATYDDCVDLLARVPGNRPVAFRMPCCDSLNTLSPRFFSEIFARRTPQGNFLELDSSVFVKLTADDPQLPRELVVNSDGSDRFARYVPFESYVNTIDDYPYPYVIGGYCWELPCIVPSDWSAQHVQRPRNPRTLDDLQAALDAVVVKQGVFDLVFHPYDWIGNHQLVRLIDQAVSRHGPRVKFLNFAEVRRRLCEHLLCGQSLRAADGGDNGVRLLDLDGDGYLDVVIANEQLCITRLWRPQTLSWDQTDFPVPLVRATAGGSPRTTGARFGIVAPHGQVGLWVADEEVRGAWRFDAGQWVAADELWGGLAIDGRPLMLAEQGRDRGARLADLDGDGACEFLVANEADRAVFVWRGDLQSWQPAEWNLPQEVQFVDAGGHDRGLRLVDLDEDLDLDLVFSNESRYDLYLFGSLQEGYSQKLHAAPRAAGDAIPMIVRGAGQNGAWFHSRHLWVQNEDTARMKDLVDRRSFNELLSGAAQQPRSPTASLAALRVRSGFQVELVAAEPLVLDPVGFDWDEQGRLLVVEMADYPLGIDNRGTPGGRLRRLEDSDGDGRYDRAELLADDLPYPTGVLSWEDGALVTAAPDILFLADRDGDGRAEIRHRLYTGFSEGNQQHRINGFERGLDNWIYCANGHSGGTVRSLQTGHEVPLGGRDLRLRPREGLLDPQLGVTQFFRAQDDWGNWFGNSNTEPLYQFVLADHYLRRNPHVAPPLTRVDVPELPGSAPIFARSRTLERFNDLHTADRFTSACGTILYRDELLGPAFEGNSFVSEPVHNLVHREVVVQDGLIMRSRRAADEQHSEFLASSDNWFRPTALKTGPDGALWVADMYRLVIEHPEWIPAEKQRTLDVRAGSDRGRIYRIYPVGTAPRPIPRLGAMSTGELVEVLQSPNGWQRAKAQELLVARGDPAARAALVKLVTDAPRPTARIHALSTLEGAFGPPGEVLLAALADPHPEVRRHAVRTSEAALQAGTADELGAAIARLVDDPAPQVRLQAASSLGEWDHPAAGEALARLAVASRDDPFLTAAVLSSALPRLAEIAAGVVAAWSAGEPDTELLAALVDSAVGAENRAALALLVGAIVKPTPAGYRPWQIEASARLMDALARRRTTLSALWQADDSATGAGAQAFAGLMAFARARVKSSEAGDVERLAAVGLLGRSEEHAAEDRETLLALLAPQNSRELQAAALERLGRSDDAEVPRRLLIDWERYTPALRSEILELVFRRDAWLGDVLDALEAGRLPRAELDAGRRQRLVAHRMLDVRRRAAALFNATGDDDRARVVRQHEAVLGLSGDAARGKELFDKKCGVCHRLGGSGQAIGPDLGALTDTSPQALLPAILDPNRAVESKYVSYTAVTIGGLTYTGLLAAETSTSVTLLAQEGKQQVVLRSELETLASTGKSLMPEGLERELSHRDLADLLAYVGQSGPRPKAFAGNRPALVVPEALRGELACLSTNAEIFGDTLIFEGENGNLGYWQSANDHAVWTIEVPRRARYQVILEWACDDASAGNTLLLEAGTERLTARVNGTGGWQHYRREVVGGLVLEPGRYRLGLRASGPLTNCLFDLKSITLRPGLGL